MTPDGGAHTPTPEDAEGPVGRLTADEVRSRAATGGALLGARGALIYALAIGANLVLARLLVPRDFGLVTLGAVILATGTYLGEAGIAAALIRREEPPERIELESINGLQLAVTLAIAIVCVGVAVPFGRDGFVVAVMAASLPITVLRLPSVVVLERQLRYRAIATTDVVEAVSYYLWAIVTVALGFGVWGLATAVLVRALVGTTTMIAIGPLGVLRPRRSWEHVRPLLNFGAKYLATGMITLARIQGLNLIVAAVSGIATLGVWNLAWRVLQVPSLLFVEIGRVAYPAMSRLLGAGEDPRRAIERGLAVLAILTGTVIVALVALAPAIPAMVGKRWGDVSAVLLWSGVALILSAPIVVGTAGYLLAAGEPGAVARAALASTIVWFGVAVALLPSVGPPAVGIGWIASGAVDGALLARATLAGTGAAIAAELALPTAAALAATGAAWLIATGMPDALIGGVLGVFAGEVLLLATFAIASRPALRDTRSLVALALGTFRIKRSVDPAGSMP